MRVHCLQHVPQEGPGRISGWAEDRGHTFDRTLLSDPAATLPSADDVDILVVLGGPMGANDDGRYAWMPTEKQFITECLSGGDVAVLGICLGAQLLAGVLGGSVRPAPEREIGWFDVTLTPHGRDSDLLGGLPGTFPALHWHSDMFGIPRVALHLASSAACPNQAFSFGDRVLGLQFHLEPTEASWRELIGASTDDLVRGGRWVSSAKEMLRDPRRFEESAPLMDRVLDALAGVARS